jgi:hypothetical protein
VCISTGKQQSAQGEIEVEEMNNVQKFTTEITPDNSVLALVVNW